MRFKAFFHFCSSKCGTILTQWQSPTLLMSRFLVTYHIGLNYLNVFILSVCAWSHLAVIKKIWILQHISIQRSVRLSSAAHYLLKMGKGDCSSEVTTAHIYTITLALERPKPEPAPAWGQPSLQSKFPASRDSQWDREEEEKRGEERREGEEEEKEKK